MTRDEARLVLDEGKVMIENIDRDILNEEELKFLDEKILKSIDNLDSMLRR